MQVLFGIDWRSALLPSVSPPEISIREALVYLIIYFLLRVVRRQAGELVGPHRGLGRYAYA